MSVSACTSSYAAWCMCESQRTMSGTASLLLCEFQELNSDGRSWEAILLNLSYPTSPDFLTNSPYKKKIHPDLYFEVETKLNFQSNKE